MKFFSSLVVFFVLSIFQFSFAVELPGNQRVLHLSTENLSVGTTLSSWTSKEGLAFSSQNDERPRVVFCNEIGCGDTVSSGAKAVYFNSRQLLRLGASGQALFLNNETKPLAKTYAFLIRTGEDVQSHQVIYEQGDSKNGYQFSLDGGRLVLSYYLYVVDKIEIPINAGMFTTTQTTLDKRTVSFDVAKNTYYRAVVVADNLQWRAYLDDIGNKKSVSGTSSYGRHQKDVAALGGVGNYSFRAMANYGAVQADTLAGHSYLFDMAAWNRVLTLVEIEDVLNRLADPLPKNNPPDIIRIDSVPASPSMPPIVVEPGQPIEIVVDDEDGDSVCFAVEPVDSPFSIQKENDDVATLNTPESEAQYSVSVKVYECDNPEIFVRQPLVIDVVDSQKPRVVNPLSTLINGSVDEDFMPFSVDLDEVFSPSVGLSYSVSLDQNGVFDYSLSGSELMFHSIAHQSGGPVKITVTGVVGEYDVSDQVMLEVLPVNDNPVLQTNAGLQLQAGQIVVITSTMLKGEDVDHAPSALFYVITQKPSQGELLLNDVVLDVNDSFTEKDLRERLVRYRHLSGNGAEHFSFRLEDGASAVADNMPADFTIVIEDAPNTAPTADDVPTLIVTNEDEPVVIDVLAYANDVDDDELFVHVAEVRFGDGDENATVAYQHCDGSMVQKMLCFQPSENVYGRTTVYYTITDNRGGQAIARVDIDVRPVNDLPVMLDVSGLEVSEDGSLLITLSGTDVEDGVVSDFGAQLTGLSGAWVFESDNQIRFTPGDDFQDLLASQQRSVGISVWAVDSVGDESVPVTLNVVVVGANDNPDGPAVIERTVDVGQMITIDLSSLISDLDGDIDWSTLEIIDSPIGVIVNGQVIEYTGISEGTFTVDYRVTDSRGNVFTGQIEVIVRAVAGLPVAKDDASFTTPVDQTLTSAISVLLNDDSPEGLALFVVNPGVGMTTSEGGMVDLGEAGYFVYNPSQLGPIARDNVVSDTFTYRVRDAAGNVGLESATVTINVTGVNNAPVITVGP